MRVIKKLIRNIVLIISKLIYVMKDIILRTQGYVKLEEIKIPSHYTRPRQEKLDSKKKFYKKYKTLPQIIINENKYLVNGFCTYFLAAVWKWEYVKVRRVRSVKR